MKRNWSCTLILVFVSIGCAAPIRAGTFAPFNVESLLELLEQIRNDPQTTSRDLLERVADWRRPSPTPAPPTSTPTPTQTSTPTITPTPTEIGPTLPVGFFARVGEWSAGISTGRIAVSDAEIFFNSGVYRYRDYITVTLEVSGNQLRGSLEQPGFIREITLTFTGNDRYLYEDKLRDPDSPNNLISASEGVLFPQSQWGPFTGFYRGLLTTTDTTTNRTFPCITNDIGRSINIHMLEIDGQIQILTNTFAIALTARFDPDNPDTFALGGGPTAMWDGVFPGGNFVGCAPAGTASVSDNQTLTLNRDASGANLTGTYFREVPFTDGTLETITQSLEAERQNLF